jgi:endonuclease/exonuclease/phosphatase (EEP) superfamily protein YafD
MIKRISIITLALCLLFLIWIVISLPGNPSAKSNAHILRIGAKNILFSNPHTSDLLQETIEEQLDIILFMEYNGKNINLNAFRQKGYGAVVVHPRPYTHGMLLLAKNGIIIEGVIKAAPLTGLCRLPFIVARAVFQGDSLALLGVHIPPPTKRCKANRQPTLDYFASLIDSGRLCQDINPAKRGDPVIMLGDFNAISFESVLNPLFEAGLDDAYSRHNWRLGPTWSQPTWFPALFRLDYILVSEEISTMDAWTVHIKGSDHRGIVGDVLLR